MESGLKRTDRYVFGDEGVHISLLEQPPDAFDDSYAAGYVDAWFASLDGSQQKPSQKSMSLDGSELGDTEGDTKMTGVPTPATPAECRINGYTYAAARLPDGTRVWRRLFDTTEVMEQGHTGPTANVIVGTAAAAGLVPTKR